MNLLFKLRDDFHWFVGRKLGLSNQEMTDNLGNLVGKRTDLYGHYSVLKDKSDISERRAFLLEVIQYYLHDFLGTDYCELLSEKIERKSKQIELDVLEGYVSNIVKPDGDWNEWRKMIVNFGLDTPSEFVDLESELKRLGLPKCYKDNINSSAIKFYSADRRLRNLAFTSLKAVSNEEEYITAELIYRRFLDLYYRLQGIDAKIEYYKKSLFGCTSDENKNYEQKRLGEEMPFLPALPPGVIYDAKFYEHIRNIVRGEHNLFKFEWKLAKTVRFGHHDMIVMELDKSSNDCLERAQSYGDLEILTQQNDCDQNKAVVLLKGDYAMNIFSTFLNDSGVETDEKQDFLRKWVEHDTSFVISVIEESYVDGNLDKKKIVDGMWKRLRCRPRVCKHFQDKSPFPCKG